MRKGTQGKKRNTEGICKVVTLLSKTLLKEGSKRVNEIINNFLSIGPTGAVIQKTIMEAIVRQASEFIDCRDIKCKFD